MVSAWKFDKIATPCYIGKKKQKKKTTSGISADK